MAGGTERNLDFLEPFLSGGSFTERLILCDAQTSGGLLISIPPKFADEIIDKLNQNGHKKASIIGKVTKKKEFENKMINFIN